MKKENKKSIQKMKPESLMMSYGYKPELSEGAVKCPIFQTSTFVFKTAEEGKSFFEVAGFIVDLGSAIGGEFIANIVKGLLGAVGKIWDVLNQLKNKVAVKNAVKKI